MPPKNEAPTIEDLTNWQTQAKNLTAKNKQLQETLDDLSNQNDSLKLSQMSKTVQADTLEQQVSGLRERLQAKIPADLAKKLTAFFNGPAVGMNNTEKADAIIALLSA